MFDKARIMWALASLEGRAGTSAECRAAIHKIAGRAELLETAITLARQEREPELGAACLIVTVADVAVRTNAPLLLLRATSALLVEAVAVIQKHQAAKPGAVFLGAQARPVLEAVRLATKLAEDSYARGAAPESTAGDSGKAPAAPKFPFSPSMPDVLSARNTQTWDAGDYVLRLFVDARMIAERMGMGGPPPISYPYVLAAFTKRTSAPALFVTLEKSMFGTRALCAFDSQGVHHNIGTGEKYQDENLFAEAALGVAMQSLGIKSVRAVG